MDKSIFLISFIFISIFGFAQNSVSEYEIETQKVFIEANKEKLLGNYEKSVKLFKNVLEKDKKNDVALYELSRVYDALDKNQEALTSIKKAIDLNSSNHWYKLFLADIYEKLQNYESAAKIYRALIDNNHKESYYFFRLSEYQTKAGNYKAALKTFDEMEKIHGLNEELIKKKHALYAILKDNKNAALEINKLIDAYPNEKKYRHLLAGFYDQIRDKENQIETYKSILEIDPNDEKSKLALIDLQDSNSSSLSQLMPIVKNPNESIDFKIKSIIPYLKKIDPNKIEDIEKDNFLKICSILRTDYPNDPKSFALSGDLEGILGNDKKAITYYEKSTKLGTNVPQVWLALIDLYGKNKNYSKIYETTEKAFDIFPNTPEFYYFNGLAAVQLGKKNEAKSILNQALLMSRKKEKLTQKINIILNAIK